MNHRCDRALRHHVSLCGFESLVRMCVRAFLFFFPQRKACEVCRGQIILLIVTVLIGVNRGEREGQILGDHRQEMARLLGGGAGNLLIAR